MNPGLNREASEARMADLRRQAGRDAVAIAVIKAAKRESARTQDSMIRALRRSLRSHWIRRRQPVVIAADTDSASSGSEFRGHDGRDPVSGAGNRPAVQGKALPAQVPGSATARTS